MSKRYWERALSLVEGCTPLSRACDHCWATAATHMRQHQTNRKVSGRYEGLTDARGRFNGNVRLICRDLGKPHEFKRPTVWSVWNDLFHEAVPRDFIHDAFRTMSACKRHTFLILTKRPERIYPVLYGAPERYLGGGDYLGNVWLGTTVESQEYVGRLDHIGKLCEAGWRTFVSCEPLLGPVNLWHWIYEPYGSLLWWVILGAETGPHARPMELEWARLIARDCVNAGVPLFVKAVSGGAPIPPDLDIQQLPW